MIMLTGHGSFATQFAKNYPSETISFRSSSDSQLRDKLKKASTVIHNAANIHCDSLSECVEDNFLGTKRLIDLSLKANPKIRIIYLSSMSFLDTQNSPKELTEMSSYAYSKYLAETYLNKSPLTAVSIRFSTLFYKDPQKDGLSKLIHDAAIHRSITLINHGEATRDFIPLDVAVQYVYRITQKPDFNPSAINVVSGVETSFAQVANQLQQLVTDLKINHQHLSEVPNVLAKFDTEPLKVVGLIKFDLQDQIKSYLDQLIS